MADKLSWTDVHEIGYRLCQRHRGVDPLTVRFTDLRRMVEVLPEFAPLPEQSVNEQILEAIQCAWQEEFEDAADDPDEDGRYTPPTPYRP